MKKVVALMLLASFAAPVFALDGKQAAYVGGTFTPYAGSKDVLEGTWDISRPDALLFTPKHQPALTIPYKEIIDLEYGQKAGRRVGAAIGTSLLLGPIGLVTLFSKKRNHYLTIGYHGADGMDQVAVMELGKDIIRTSLAVLETRSGKPIEFQDDEARKSGKGGR